LRGSRAITDAPADVLRGHGGRIETGRRVRLLAEVQSAGAVVDVTGVEIPLGVGI